MKTPKPTPVPVNIVCSLCGENWSSHGADPTTLDCIRLLKAKARTVISWPSTQPYWYWTGTSGLTTTSGCTTVSNGYLATNAATATPRQIDAPTAVGS